MIPIDTMYDLELIDIEIEEADQTALKFTVKVLSQPIFTQV